MAILLPALVQSQVTEDFSDAELSENPCWSGDTSHFKISFSSAIPLSMRPGLQLDAPSAGSSAIHLQFGDLSSVSWSFWLKMSFNSSTNNFARIILKADRVDPTGAFYGYFLQIGGSDDSVRFCRQDSLAMQTLLTFPGLFAGNATNAFRWLVLEKAGHWIFYADPAGEQQLILQGEITDDIIPRGDIFMFRCQYTTSNITKIYFDDLVICEYIPDTIGPVLDTVIILSPSSLQTGFNEAVETTQALNPLNYELSGLGQPSSLTMKDSRHVLLEFDGEMTAGMHQSLKIRNATDLFGNVSDEIVADFVFNPIQPWDVLITEIMADPTPSQGLPETEYLELFNRKPHSLDIGGCHINMNDAEADIPPGTILEGYEYALLLAEDMASEFVSFGKIIGVEGLDLDNMGAFLMLCDSAGSPIDCFSYDMTWYHDEAKSEGGWSLERIDPGLPCLGSTNWAASIGTTGGTPCGPSGFGPAVPEPVRLLNACCPDASTVSVLFDRAMAPGKLSDPGLYSVDHSIGHPDTVSAGFPDPVRATLSFGTHFVEGVNYTLSVSEDMANCSGEEVGTPLDIGFGLPSHPGFMDVVVNEVLFNPLGNGVDYIELFNRSGNIISLDSLIIAVVEESPPAPPDTDTYSLPGGCLALQPGSYFVLTPDPSLLESQYLCPKPERIIRMDPFPPLNNTEGYIILRSKNKETLDEMHYAEEMHYPLLATFEGVALERIYPGEPGTRPDNWHSASWSAGFGTPGHENSQYRESLDGTALLKISPEAFSPDGDGVDDVVTISCHFESAEWLGRIWLFDSYGRRVRLLVDNELMGADNDFAWDGLADDRSKAAPGIYVILLESVDLKGHSTRCKKAVALVVR